MLSTNETLNLFPLLNRYAIYGALYSPGDGVIDPTMLCNALTKLAKKLSGAEVFENCSVNRILINQNERGKNVVTGVETSDGIIKTNCIVNATGVWSRDLIEEYGITLPVIPMKHAYIVTEPIEGIRGDQMFFVVLQLYTHNSQRILQNFCRHAECKRS